MAKKRYTLYFTDTTNAIIDSLEKRGHKVRNVLNAGIVLFDQADISQRGEAIAIANSMVQEELFVLMKRLRSTLDWMDSIKNKDAFTPCERETADQLRTMLESIETSPAAIAEHESVVSHVNRPNPQKKKTRDKSA